MTNQIGNFRDLGLIEPLLKAIADSGYGQPTPIQTQSIPPLLEGADLLGCAQTGTGKTAAFALPLLQRLQADPRRYVPKHTRILILTPTRELAIQIEESFRTYGKYLNIKTAVIFGGVGQQPQVKALASGVDILVATPGRLVDLMQQRYLALDGLEVFVLDEADRMLDMGFIHTIKKLITLLPRDRQTLFFSATMPANIEKLAKTMLNDRPVRLEVTPASSTVELIQQSLMYVDKGHKRDLLRHLLKDPKLKRVIVFTRTKHGANRVVEILVQNKISSAAIHGNKSQGARQKALESFREGKVRVLVATDIAARGIDVDGITHVINFEIPNIPESYVHRIGRTARAGNDGVAFSFCDSEEKSYIRDIEKVIGQKIPLDTSHPYHSENVERAGIVAPGKAKANIERRDNFRGGGRDNRARRFPGTSKGTGSFEGTSSASRGPAGGGSRGPSSNSGGRSGGGGTSSGNRGSSGGGGR